MKRTILSILTAVAAIVAANSQQKQHFTLDVKDFSELKVVDGINVDYYCQSDSAGYVVFDAEPELSSAIMFTPSDGKLTIQLASRDNIPQNLPTVRVYSRYLASVENDGDSLVRVLNVAPGPKFKAKLEGNGRLSVRDIDTNELTANLMTGNGSIVVFGRCEIAKLYLAGTGSITADELTARKVNCRLGGTGTIGCNATEELSVKGLGTGKVYYLGTPKIKNRTLGIKVERL
ncbi:MAG: DUF2807 domain-containing protein [Clostridium sp.]|nr:DUF2807 domain-containing protein [Clostridium sp.]